MQFASNYCKLVSVRKLIYVKKINHNSLCWQERRRAEKATWSSPQTMETEHYWIIIQLEISFIFSVAAHQTAFAKKRFISGWSTRGDEQKRVVSTFRTHSEYDLLLSQLQVVNCVDATSNQIWLMMCLQICTKSFPDERTKPILTIISYQNECWLFFCKASSIRML